MPSQESLDEFTLIRQSPVLLLFRLLLVLIGSVLFTILMRFPLESFFETIERRPLERSETIWVGIGLFAFVSFMEVIFISWITLRWMAEHYVVRPGAVIHRRGIFKLLEETYSLKNVEAFTVEQNLFQRMLRYGHIKFYSPVLKQEYYIKNISHPIKIKETVQELTEEETPYQTFRQKIIPKAG